MAENPTLPFPAAPSRLSRLRRRFAEAVPSPSTILFGSVIWGGLCVVSALLGLYLHNALIIPTRLAVLSLYFYGGAAAFAPGLMLNRLLFAGSGRILRFIGASILMFLVTHTVTAGLFALQYRVFYSYWHANFLSVIWFFQLTFTSAAAVYQFSVDSLYVYWPAGPLLFLAFGLWFARKPH